MNAGRTLLAWEALPQHLSTLRMWMTMAYHMKDKVIVHHTMSQVMWWMAQETQRPEEQCKLTFEYKVNPLFSQYWPKCTCVSSHCSRPAKAICKSGKSALRISEIIQTFRESIQSEILALNEKIKQLSYRITELESVTSRQECHSSRSELSTELASGERSNSVVVSTPPTTGIETQVAHLTETISMQQKNEWKGEEREEYYRNGSVRSTWKHWRSVNESKLGVVNVSHCV